MNAGPAAMAETDIDRYAAKMNAAAQLYQDDNWPQCPELCEEFLEHRGALTRYLRIRVLVPAAATTNVYWDAEKWREEAEDLWHIGKRIFPRKLVDEAAKTESDPLLQ